MGIVTFLRNIGQLQKSNNPAPINSNPGNYPVEYVRTMSFNKAFKDLLSQDQFIARSDYKDLVEQYRDLSQFYATLVQSNILNEYVAKHNLDIEAINYFRNGRISYIFHLVIAVDLTVSVQVFVFDISRTYSA